MKVCETFTSFQGEINVGRFAFFIRLGSCNLNCQFCDTPYKNDYVELTVDEIIEQAEHFPRVVITGGEPLLQKEDVSKVIQKLKRKNPDIVIEIETNGTIKPMGGAILSDVIFNVSPKLKNSGNDYNKRIDVNTLGWFVQAEANFKFVVDNEDDIDEVNLLVSEFGIKKRQVFLMPEGKTREEQLEKMEKIARYAKVYGYNISPRLHVIIWNTERGK